MTKNRLSRQLVDDITKYLVAGGKIITRKDRPDLRPCLSTPTKHALPSGTRLLPLFRQVIRYMSGQSLITIQVLPKKQIRIRLASAGIKRSQKIALRDMQVPHPRKWDGKWRLVFFDIPENNRSNRNRLTGKLKLLGFYQLGRSLWVYPFACNIEIEYLKRAYGVGKYVSLAEITKIDRSKTLTRHFGKLLAEVRS